MCVVALALDTHPQWRIILAGNRDEFHARPSAPLSRWDGADSHILAGRDLVSGGTWLGVSETGRLAVVTNIRTGAMPDPDKRSRGDLVAGYLRGEAVPALSTLNLYNAFSLMTIGPEGATLCANRPSPLYTPVPSGIHGLSNGLPDEEWHRKSALLNAFAQVVKTATDMPVALLNMLANESIDDSIFIRSDVYGTRCSTIVLVDYQGAGMFVEQRFGPKGLVAGQTNLTFGFKLS